MFEAVALVVGSGALGQNVLLDLALSGVRELRLVDRDRFEGHNRTRSPFYPNPEEQERYGLAKVRVVAEKLLPLMTAPEPIVRYADNWVQELGDGAFLGVSVIVSCVDTPLGRAYLSDKARLHGIPMIEAGFNGSQLSLSAYPAAEIDEARVAPCWRCANQELIGAFSCRFYAMAMEEAGIIPAIQNAASALAAFQAEAAVQAIHGEMPLAYRGFDLDLRTSRARPLLYSTDPDCPGEHRRLEGTAEFLELEAGSSLADLVRLVEQRLGAGARLELPSPFVWEAPCTTCGQGAAVHAPDWRWIMNPRCSACGGDTPRVPHGGRPDSPWVTTWVASTTRPDLLALPAAVVGFTPLTLLEAHTLEGKSTIFRLAGNLDELFVQVPSPDSRG
jgi:molybdopterin/thiamine biosynthesis adenylyltransferase